MAGEWQTDQVLLTQRAQCAERSRSPRRWDEKALNSDRDSGRAAERREHAGRCALPALPGAHPGGWVFKRKFVVKNYDAPARSPTQRRKSRLHALSFPPLGTF